MCCSSLENKTALFNNWFNNLLTNDLYNTVQPASKFVSVIVHYIQSIHKHCNVPLVLKILTAFWTASQRSIHCLLKTTGHNKWIILFAIKAPVPKWILLMFKFIFHAQLKKRGKHHTRQGKRSINHTGSNLLKSWRMAGLYSCTRIKCSLQISEDTLSKIILSYYQETPKNIFQYQEINGLHTFWNILPEYSITDMRVHSIGFKHCWQETEVLASGEDKEGLKCFSLEQRKQSCFEIISWGPWFDSSSPILKAMKKSVSKIIKKVEGDSKMLVRT